MPLAALLPILKSPITWMVAVAIAAVILIAVVYSKGERAGASKVETEVQRETVKQIDRARTEKNKADDAVRSKPIDEVIDGLK